MNTPISPAPAEEPGRTAALHRLAAERATGVLLRECGTLYLVDGQVTHAESPSTPGLEVLLTAGGALPTQGWREAVTKAGAQHCVGRFLIDSGRLTDGALELCHLGALYDAAFFVLGPSRSPDTFRPGIAHWIGPIHPVSAGSVERETARRQKLLERIWPDPATDTAPLRHASHPATPAVSARQRAVLDRVDGTRTAADIARLLGRTMFHTLVSLRRLAAAGLVTPAHAPAAALPPWVTDLSASPDTALLRRVRDALEAL